MCVKVVIHTGHLYWLADWLLNMGLSIALRYLLYIKTDIMEKLWAVDLIRLRNSIREYWKQRHGKVTGTPVDAAEVKEMVHIAHEEGFAVMSHTNGIYGTRAAIEAGVDSLEHGNYMDEETIVMLADSNTVWVPTLVTVRNLVGCGRYEDGVLKPIIHQAEVLVRLAYQKKVKVAPGSDAGAYMVPHGKGILQEWGAFRQILGDSEEVKEWLETGEKEIRDRFKRK